MTNQEIREFLFRNQDKAYRDFQAKLLPTLDCESIIGVRTPILRRFAKKLSEEADCSDFLRELPHRYFEENQLHAFLISEVGDYALCIEELERFLPFVDNWATCDQMSPVVFKKHKVELLSRIELWLSSEKTYTLRFAVRMLMQHFLEDGFRSEYPKMISEIRSEEYYVNMMIAWYFATALARQYDSILPFLENQALQARTHNMSIRKALESYRISDEQKDYLRTLRRKKETH